MRPTINRRGWLATQWQDRRRKRRFRNKPVVPPAPVAVTFEVIDNAGVIDVNITWAWEGLGWPADGYFYIYIEKDDTHTQGGGTVPVTAAVVAATERNCSLAGIDQAEDIGYYCRLKYQKNTAASPFTEWIGGNPY